MDEITKRYHLLLTVLEASTLLALGNLFHQQVHPALAKKKIQAAQMQASSLGSQLAHAQLEDKLPDENLPVLHAQTPIQPVAIEDGITIGMLGVIARTAIIETYRASSIAVYSANEVNGWIWITEGPNPCAFCESMNGTEHLLSEEFESHPNCKCGTEPYIS